MINDYIDCCRSRSQFSSKRIIIASFLIQRSAFNADEFCIVLFITYGKFCTNATSDGELIE